MQWCRALESGGDCDTTVEAVTAESLKLVDNVVDDGDGGDACVHVAGATEQHALDGTGVEPVQRLNKRLRTVHVEETAGGRCAGCRNQCSSVGGSGCKGIGC